MMSLVEASAEFSPGLTVVLTTIFLVFVLSVWFMYRIGVEQMDTRSGMVVNFAAPNQAMGQVYNPYVLEMTNKFTASLADGVTLSLTTQLPCELRSFWGVNIKDIYPVVHQQWSHFSDQVQEETLLQGSYLSRQDVIHFDACENHAIHLKPSVDQGSSFDLGPRPRARYPLVVVVTQPGASSFETEDEVEENQIVCVVLIVHLKDEVCPVDSHIIAHYIRTSTGPPHNMQQLYVTSGESGEEGPSGSSNPTTNSTESARQTQEPSSSSPPSTSSSSAAAAAETAPQPEIPICVICQVSPVTQVILPCRHACLCSRCFPRVQNCPVCRGYIISHFSMNTDGDIDDTDTDYEVDESIPVHGEHWWMRVNERLNQFFGFG